MIYAYIALMILKFFRNLGAFLLSLVFVYISQYCGIFNVNFGSKFKFYSF